MKQEKLISNFEAALDDHREETIQNFLSHHPAVLLSTFGHPWAVNECIPKMKLGIEYVTDFVIVTGQSYSYDITLIELEPPLAKPFTSSGKYARRLNDAMGQLNDWFSWIEMNRAYFLNTVSKSMKSLYGASQVGRVINGNDQIFFSSKIVIGRRAMLSEADNLRRSAVYASTNKKIEIVPYDRLLDVAKRGSAGPREGFDEPLIG